jgi:hypothetical protein
MADVTVRIASDGSFSPPTLDVQVGDAVTFAAEADSVLCVAPAAVFGGERFEIPAGHEKKLQVQDAASSLDFIARVGDLAAPCRGGGRERTSRGGGSVGGGLD